MPPTLRRLAILAAAGTLTAAELAPSADQGALPDLAPRTWFLFNAAPDDQAVAAQVPRRREAVIGASRIVDEEHGLGVHVEGVWSPVRAAREDPAVRVDELLTGIGGSLEHPGKTFAWRLSATAGVRVLTDLHTEEYDRFENRVFRGDSYQADGQAEDPESIDPLLTAHWTGLVRLTESDPLREAPVDVVFDARILRLFPWSGGDDGDPDLRLGALLVLPSRTTMSWFGFSWQRIAQPTGGSLALTAVNDLESGWWFNSGAALRLGASGDWLVELGSGIDLASGIAVGTIGVVRTGDGPRATADGTSSLELVMLRSEAGTSAGFSSGDQLKRAGAYELRSEIRTLVGERSHPQGTESADALRLDAMLRGQLAFNLSPLVRFGPEMALGLGLRRDAVEFADNSFAATNRIAASGDFGVAGRVSTSWKNGIASLGASLGWAWWRALGGDEELNTEGQSFALADSGSGLILRCGLLATF